MTLTYSEIMVRYGELSTKGKNRMRFINKLRNNIKDVLSIYPDVKVTFDRDRGHIYLNGTDYEPVAESLKQIFGIQAFSPVYKFEKDVEVLKKAVQDIMTGLYRDGLTFKVTAKRSDHDFVLDSRELNLTLGNAVFDVLPDIKAQMKGPDVNLKVEIRAEAAYISHEEIKGAGGLPVGTAGKGMLMLSGGIDSPVAGYLALKRGVDIEAVHFASPPYTSPGALKKAQDLTRKLTKFGGNIQFIEVPFTEIIDLAQKIDTFDISIQPFEDCCTIFAPDRPKTNPKIKNVEQYERRMDVEALVERAVAGIMVTEITPIEEAQDEVDTLIEDLL